MKKLLLAGLGAYAYYRFTKMSPEEKANISNKIKESGKKLTEYLPGELKCLFNKKPQTT